MLEGQPLEAFTHSRMGQWMDAITGQFSFTKSRVSGLG